MIYRLYDYGRKDVDGRLCEFYLEKSVEVIDVLLFCEWLIV